MEHEVCRKGVEELRSLARDMYVALLQRPCKCFKTCTCGWDAVCSAYERSELATKGCNWPWTTDDGSVEDITASRELRSA